MAKRIEVSPAFLCMACLLAWYDCRLCICFLLGLLVHELGHAFAMAAFRIPMHSLSLRLSGAVIGVGSCGYWQEIWCTAAGPACSFLLMIICRHDPQLSAVSGLFGAVNMLPLYPLDGGRILKSVLLLHLEQDRVNRILSRTTFVVCCLLMTLACWVTAALQAGIWPVFAALVLLIRVGNANWVEQ